MEDGMLEKAHSFNNILIAKCRQNYIFYGHFEDFVDEEESNAVWIANEQSRR